MEIKFKFILLFIIVIVILISELSCFIFYTHSKNFIMLIRNNKYNHQKADSTLNFESYADTLTANIKPRTGKIVLNPNPPKEYNGNYMFSIVAEWDNHLLIADLLLNHYNLPYLISFKLRISLIPIEEKPNYIDQATDMIYDIDNTTHIIHDEPVQTKLLLLNDFNYLNATLLHEVFMRPIEYNEIYYKFRFPEAEQTKSNWHERVYPSIPSFLDDAF